MKKGIAVASCVVIFAGGLYVTCKICEGIGGLIGKAIAVPMVQLVAWGFGE